MSNVETLEDVWAKIEDTNGKKEFDRAWDAVFWNEELSQYDETIILDLSEEQALRVLNELKL